MKLIHDIIAEALVRVVTHRNFAPKTVEKWVKLTTMVSSPSEMKLIHDLKAQYDL